MNLCDDEGHKNPPKPEHLNRSDGSSESLAYLAARMKKKSSHSSCLFLVLNDIPSQTGCEKVGWDVVKYLVPVPFCSCGSILSVVRYDLYELKRIM